MEYSIDGGRYGVSLLHAPYALLVEAFGNDGINPRDNYKSMCQWTDDAAGWEVYDYKVGTCYAQDGLVRADITEWHVQATESGAVVLRAQLDAAVARLNEAALLERGEALEELYREANGQGVADEYAAKAAADAPDYSDEIEQLGDGATLRIGAEDEDEFFTGAGLEISLAGGVRAGVAEFEYGEHTGEVTMALSLDDVRKAHALLGAYLVMIDEQAAR
jgi:hypothetical protein